MTAGGAVTDTTAPCFPSAPREPPASSSSIFSVFFSGFELVMKDVSPSAPPSLLKQTKNTAESSFRAFPTCWVVVCLVCVYFPQNLHRSTCHMTPEHCTFIGRNKPTELQTLLSFSCFLSVDFRRQRRRMLIFFDAWPFF